MDVIWSRERIELIYPVRQNKTNTYTFRVGYSYTLHPPLGPGYVGAPGIRAAAMSTSILEVLLKGIVKHFIHYLEAGSATC